MAAGGNIDFNMEDIQDALPNNVELQRDEVDVNDPRVEEHVPRDREIVHVPQQNELRNNNVNEAAVGLDGRGRGRGRGRGAVLRQQRGPRRGGNPRQFGRRGQGTSGRRNDVRQLQQQPNNFFGLVHSLFRMVVNAAQNSSSSEGGRGGRGGRGRGRGIRGHVRGRGQVNRGQRGGRGARGGRDGRGGRGRGQN